MNLEKPGGWRMKTIKIAGMSCQHCVRAVTKALEGIEGIGNVTVSLERGEASFEERHPVDDQAVREAVTRAGYSVG
jgi:copper chaperone